MLRTGNTAIHEFIKVYEGHYGSPTKHVRARVGKARSIYYLTYMVGDKEILKGYDRELYICTFF